MGRWFDVVRLRLRSLFRRDAVERELDRELRFHIDEHAAELVASGLSRAEARRQALRELGPVASIADRCRDTRRVNTVEHVLNDLRYAVRRLIAQPMLAGAATASIALGVGANLGIFGLANSLLLSSPSAASPDRLAHIRTANGSHAPYRTWRALNESGVLAGIAGHQIEGNVNWRGPEASLPIAPLLVTPNYFDVVGVPFAFGRGFTSGEAERDPHIAVVSHRFWTRRLGGVSSILGSSLFLNGEPYTIVGVTPPGLRSLPGFGIVPDVWLPITPTLVPDLEHPRGGHVQLVGRLHDGQSRAAAHAALETVGVRIAADLGVVESGHIRSVTAVGGIDQMRDFKEIAAFFAVLLVVTILVLAIACANVAGLLLAQGMARRREIALRLALGASRRRIVQQLLAEGLVLSFAGTVAGLAFIAAAGLVLPRLNLPLPLPLEFHLTFDTRLATFAAILVFVSAILCSLAPAWQSTRPSVLPALKRQPPAFSTRRFTLRNVMVAGQIAVSVLLLVTTLLFLRNLGLAHTLSPEFDVARAVVGQVTFVEGRQGRDVSAVETIVDRLRALPGIETASFSAGLPLTMYTGRTGTDLRIEGHADPVRTDYETNAVGPDYFRAMGIQIVRGREFASTDRRGRPRVIVVNQEFVRRYFDGRDPIGLHVDLPTDPKPTPAIVIGVAADSKYRSVGEGREAALYEPYLQRSSPGRFVHVIARVASPTQAMQSDVRSAVLQMDPTAAVTVEPMSSALAFAFLPSRIGAVLVGALGILGAGLAMVGLYGVVSFAVTRRTSEIGIRLALGAPRAAVARLILSDGGILVGVGLVIGLGVASVITRPLAAFLVAELPSTDPFSFAGSALLLLVTSLAAAWSPMRRATRIAPAVALRVE